MTSLKVGALFAGYGGIELALASALDTEPAWLSEFDKAPSAILAHHWPNVPNLGDVTKIDWATVEPVDIITGGSPCQDLSHAGKRAGMKAGTRSGLWASMCDAIDIIRPRLVVWENVRGAFSAEADSAVEPCPICVGDEGRVTLRALGRVLGDLAELGYDARWYGLRAADVGAAHGRFRVFLFATPADAELLGWGEGAHHGAGPGTASGEGQAGGVAGHRLLGVDAPSVPGQLTLMPTPRATDGTKGGPNQRGSSGDLMLPSAVTHLFPTPSVADGLGGHLTRSGARSDELLLPGVAKDLASDSPAQDWREYEAAIRRCEQAWGRPAPSPTEPGKNGQPRLSPRFVEWLMGLPAGHVTDPAIGISRNDQLKALGNGVVPQQCAAALRAFLADIAKEASA